MEKLYGFVTNCDGEVKIIDLEIERETNKTYKLKENPIASVVRKSELPFHKVYNEAITNDLQIGKEKWNELINNNIGSLKRQLQRYKNMIIND